jgi:hypothetical protein
MCVSLQWTKRNCSFGIDEAVLGDRMGSCRAAAAFLSEYSRNRKCTVGPSSSIYSGYILRVCNSRSREAGPANGNKANFLCKRGRPYEQGCHKGRFWRKITVSRRPRLPRGRVFTVRRRGKKRVRADGTMRPRGRSPASVHTWADASPASPLSLPPLPPLPPSLPSAVRADMGLHPRGCGILFYF